MKYKISKNRLDEVIKKAFSEDKVDEKSGLMVCGEWALYTSRKAYDELKTEIIKKFVEDKKNKI